MARLPKMRMSDERERRKKLGTGSMRCPQSVDWSQAPEWAEYYSKDRDKPGYPHLSRCAWREYMPSFNPNSPYGQWGGVGGKVVDAPEFGDSDDWGLVPRPNRG